MYGLNAKVDRTHVHINFKTYIKTLFPSSASRLLNFTLLCEHKYAEDV